ncbi:MAG: ATP-binding protein [Pseudomonadota bacterium]
MPHNFSDNGLIFAPRGRDALLASNLLVEAKIKAGICTNLAQVCNALTDDVGFAILTEEAVQTGDLAALSKWVEAQPPWSDFPFVLITEKGGGPERNPAAARLSSVLGNVTFLERPFHPTTLISVARTALRGRRRQYQARAHLEELRLKEEQLEVRVKERTKQIVEQNAFVDTMITSVPAGIVTYDKDLKIVTWNPFVEKLTGIAAAEIVGHRLIDVASSMGNETMERMREALAGTSSQVVEQELVIKETGRRAFYDVQHAPLYSAQGHIIGGIAFMHDITARKRIEEQLRQSQKMEAIGQLTGGVAHDFNNLLTAILSNLDLIKKKTLGDDKLQRLIEGAVQGAERGASLTQRLLAFARRQDLHVEAIKLEPLLENIAELLRRSVGPQIVIDFDFGADLPAAKIDRNQLELAILNLAVNARDAMLDGGKITISVQKLPAPPHQNLQPGTYIVVRVKDTGTGMNEQTLKQAIEPFFSTKELGKGTGLGLSMVHGLAIQLGGNFILHSKVGEGTTAELWLPVSEEESILLDTQTEHFVEMRSPLQSTILVVDDDVLIAMSTVDLLEDLGHKVIEANSGKIALQMIENNPDIKMMITDHAMPGMTGVELAKAARVLRPDLPILLATGYADLPEGEELQLPRLGKPYHQHELAEQIARLLH